jgi:hypothetical protein
LVAGWIDNSRAIAHHDEQRPARHDKIERFSGGETKNQITADRQQEDIEWASNAPEVQQQYLGQYVVPFEGRIVAHGMDLEVVLREAAKITGKAVEELSHCAILDPLEDIPH